jgi:hypothetical protein
MIASVSTATRTQLTHLTGSWLQHDCPFCVKWAYRKMPCASQNNVNNVLQDYPECLTHPPFSQDLATCSSHFSTLWKMYLTVRWQPNPITWTFGILLCDECLHWSDNYILKKVIRCKIWSSHSAVPKDMSPADMWHCVIGLVTARCYKDQSAFTMSGTIHITKHWIIRKSVHFSLLFFYVCIT